MASISTEGKYQLTDEAARNRRVGAESGRLRATSRHVERSEDEIPQRKERREVHAVLEAARKRARMRVVPPVKERCRDDVTERARRTRKRAHENTRHRDVRMEDNRVEAERREDGEHAWIESEREERDAARERRHRFGDGMVACTREPIERARRMVDGVEAPEESVMKRAVRPVADEVREDERERGLHAKRHACEARLAMPHVVKVRWIVRQAEHHDERDERREPDELHERLRDDAIEDDVRHVGESFAREERRSQRRTRRVARRENPLDSAQQDAAHDHERHDLDADARDAHPHPSCERVRLFQSRRVFRARFTDR